MRSNKKRFVWAKGDFKVVKTEAPPKPLPIPMASDTPPSIANVPIKV